MAKSILDILIRTLTSGEKKPSELSKNLIGLQNTVKAGGIAFAAFAGAALVVDKVLDATVGVMVNYASQVRAVQFATGATAKESSKLIQVADDAKVSYESLAKAMQKAVKEGITPNIAGLAQLADEYVSLNEGSERAKFLLDKFGKSGADMAELMSKGGDAIHKMSGEISGSLVLTQQAVDQARNYEVALDDWNDLVMGLKVAIGTHLLPAMINLIGTDMEGVLLRGADATGIAGRAVEQMASGIAEATPDVETAMQVWRDGEKAMILMGDAAEDLGADYGDLIQLTMAWATADEKAKKKMAFNNILAKLSVDGLTEAEKNMAEAAGIALGQFDESAISAAERMEYLVDKFMAGELSARQFTAALNAIPDSVNVNINTNYTTSGGLPTSGNYNPNIPYATGGAFDAGQPMLVHKDEVLVPDYGGVVLTRTDAMRLMQGNGGGNGGGKTFINYGSMTFVVQGSVMDVLDELS